MFTRNRPFFAAGGLLGVIVLVALLSARSGHTQLVKPVGTRLLFPFASNQAGFDTGIAISNTGLDRDGNIGRAGTATIRYFSNGGPPVVKTTPSNPARVGYTFLVSADNPGFQGYIEADCNFPLAHGYGFFSDLGARNLASSIPALVLPQQRLTSPVESLGQ